MLTVREQMVLQIEREQYRYAAVKDTRVLDELGMSPTRYFQVVNQLLDRTDALAYDPQLVLRLRRLRDVRRRARSG